MRYLTSGESHGQCLNAIIEGFPAGVEINQEIINKELARRQVGYGRGGRMQIEKDKVNILSGVRFNLTTGAPISVEIKNKDWANWTEKMSVTPVENPPEKITALRPGHADFAGAIKYNQDDIRNILERSSARETATRVAVGGFSKIFLNNFDIDIFSHVTQIGNVKAKNLSDCYAELKQEAEESDLRCADREAAQEMRDLIDKTKEKGDSLGGYVEIIIRNLPVGLGSYVHWDRKLDALLAQAVMSIPAVKSVEIGAGINAAHLPGSKMHDEILPGAIRKTNHAGGIEGGMTNGEPIVIKAAMKAIPTMIKPLKSIDLATGEEHLAHVERADVCAVAACGVVAEAMVAQVIMNAFLEKFGHDNLNEIKRNYNSRKQV